MSGELPAHGDHRTGHAATEISGASLFPLGRKHLHPSHPSPVGLWVGVWGGCSREGAPLPACPSAQPVRAPCLALGSRSGLCSGSGSLARVKPPCTTPGTRAGRLRRGRAGSSRAEPSPLASVPGAEGGGRGPVAQPCRQLARRAAEPRARGAAPCPTVPDRARQCPIVPDRAATTPPAAAALGLKLPQTRRDAPASVKDPPCRGGDLCGGFPRATP